MSGAAIITMAGEGSRFRQAGYTVPKYEIEAHGRTLFGWSMESLRSCISAEWEFIFIARDHTNVDEFIDRECAVAGIAKYHVRKLNALTDGQATTAMLAEPHVSDCNAPIAIYNIDTFVDPAYMDVGEARGQGWVPCFPGEGDKWSFAAADSEGRITEVREKKRISPHATVGLYWFDSFNSYADAYDRYYARPENLEARERYIAPLYNQLIHDGDAVYLHTMPASAVYPLGTPEDVAVFEAMSGLPRMAAHSIAAY